jgi:integrase
MGCAVNGAPTWAATILCAVRTGETLGMIFDEIDFDTATLSIPKERMKMDKPHDVPLSTHALDILRAQEAERGSNPHVFPGRPMRPLSNMSMAMLMRRLGAGDFTAHGFRTSFRTWAGENKVAFEIAEHCLAHAVGNAASQAYNRTTLLNLRRPVMASWAAYVTGDPDWKRYLKDDADSNVVPIKRGAA